MSLRSAMLRVANVIRAIPSKPGLDVWPTTVTVRTRTWAGGLKGREGGFTDVDLLITPTPHVREVSQADITGSGGRYVAGDVLVEHITPAHASNPGVGYTQAQVAPTASANGVQIIYVLTGEIAGEYSRHAFSAQDTVTYTLVLRRTRATP